MTIINQTQQENQLPTEIQVAFKDLKVLKHLRDAGFKKQIGFACSYLFQIIFCLIFHHRNRYCLLEGPLKEMLPGKDAVYRFLNHPKFAWRRFLSSLSSDTINTVTGLTAAERVKGFFIDDSMYERNRSKTVELLARFKDHARGCYYKGFRMLTWAGQTDAPLCQ